MREWTVNKINTLPKLMAKGVIPAFLRGRRCSRNNVSSNSRNGQVLFEAGTVSVQFTQDLFIFPGPSCVLQDALYSAHPLQ